jgi:hypothetical protein
MFGTRHLLLMERRASFFGTMCTVRGQLGCAFCLTYGKARSNGSVRQISTDCHIYGTLFYLTSKLSGSRFSDG